MPGAHELTLEEIEKLIDDRVLEILRNRVEVAISLSGSCERENVYLNATVDLKIDKDVFSSGMDSALLN